MMFIKVCSKTKVKISCQGEDDLWAVECSSCPFQGNCALDTTGLFQIIEIECKNCVNGQKCPLIIEELKKRRA